MSDPFKYPESTTYAPQQPFAYTTPYLRGVYQMRPANVSDQSVSGDVGTFDSRFKEKENTKGFSVGSKLQAAQFSEATYTAPITAVRRPPPASATKRKKPAQVKLDQVQQ